MSGLRIPFGEDLRNTQYATRNLTTMKRTLINLTEKGKLWHGEHREEHSVPSV